MGFDIMDVPNIHQGRSVSIFTSLPSSELGWSGWLGIIYDFDKGDTDFCSWLPSDSMNADGKTQAVTRGKIQDNASFLCNFCILVTFEKLI